MKLLRTLALVIAALGVAAVVYFLLNRTSAERWGADYIEREILLTQKDPFGCF